jgi:hypothetical protein
LTKVEFDVRYNYEEADSGILLPVRLVFASQQVELRARLDTGASDCIFDAHYADLLGIEITSGLERAYRTVTGSFRAFGHEVTLMTLGLEWNAIVFFYDSGNPSNAFLGRRGWLDRVRLGIIHYEQQLLLDHYNH